jgi:uncharacterized protein YeaO (DUF488 family)
VNLRIRRVYDSPRTDDGLRVLVDRLWPRGLTKERARVDLWLKDIAPSTELRKSFGHDPTKWEMFREAYSKEIAANGRQVSILSEKIDEGDVTLLYGARDQEHNEAVVLRDYMERLREEK